MEGKRDEEDTGFFDKMFVFFYVAYFFFVLGESFRGLCFRFISRSFF